jgi:hypothetical protein
MLLMVEGGSSGFCCGLGLICGWVGGVGSGWGWLAGLGYRMLANAFSKTLHLGWFLSILENLSSGLFLCQNLPHISQNFCFYFLLFFF